MADVAALVPVHLALPPFVQLLCSTNRCQTIVRRCDDHSTSGRRKGFENRRIDSRAHTLHRFGPEQVRKAPTLLAAAVEMVRKCAVQVKHRNNDADRVDCRLELRHQGRDRSAERQPHDSDRRRFLLRDPIDNGTNIMNRSQCDNDVHKGIETWEYFALSAPQPVQRQHRKGNVHAEHLVHVLRAQRDQIVRTSLSCTVNPDDPRPWTADMTHGSDTRDFSTTQARRLERRGKLRSTGVVHALVVCGSETARYRPDHLEWHGRNIAPRHTEIDEFVRSFAAPRDRSSDDRLIWHWTNHGAGRKEELVEHRLANSTRTESARRQIVVVRSPTRPNNTRH